MIKLTQQQRVIGVILLAWIVTSLACNLPMRTGNPANLRVEDLRQTLDAQYLAATQGTISTPTPGLPPDTSLFIGLQTATPPNPLQATLLPPDISTPGPYIVYPAQSGDTLVALAKRFGVRAEEIKSPQAIESQGLIPPGQLLEIPNVLSKTASPAALLPDSEVINSPSAADFNLHAFISLSSGYLSGYSESVDGEILTGVEIVERVASQASVNPMLLLALLEYQSGWVLGQPRHPDSLAYPLRMHVSGRRGLYQELATAATQLNLGYYGWRQGILTDLKFANGTVQRISPGLNAGSVALQHLFALLQAPEEWSNTLYGEDGIIATHQRMFGDPWLRAAQVEPVLPAGLVQPDFVLPFPAGERWSLTGGPHFSWNTSSPRGALDFAPVTGEPACTISRAWVTAPASGVVVRSNYNVLALDLDGDGLEQTGWVLVFLHLADKDRQPVGARLEMDDPLGHPSCEGGRATGTHVHIARKYNGEWLGADWPLPFVLSGWQAVAGPKNYGGELVKGEQVVSANPGGPRSSVIIR